MEHIEIEWTTKWQIEKILRNSWEQVLYNENIGATWKA